MTNYVYTSVELNVSSNNIDSDTYYEIIQECMAH